MSNSSLATEWVPAYTGNYNKGRRGHTIKAIAIHHMAGKLTARRCGELFQVVGRGGSSHYGVGYDGGVAQYVDEADTAWTNSNATSNAESVTIETSNDPYGGPDWKVNDITLNSLIKLVADIAKRNKLYPLVKGKNVIWHSMFAATACPGPYLLSKIDYIIQEANKIIAGDSDTIVTTTPVTIQYQVYDGVWLGNITQHNPNDGKYGYAGVFGKPISGVYVDASVGNVYYRSKLKDGGWLGEIKNRTDYSGILGKPIDGFMIRSDSTKLYYQAHDAKHGWMGVISGYDINDANNGYAGWTGHAIDAIMIWADPIVTTTVVEKPKVEVPKEQIYRVRKSWDDPKSQVGAYKSLQSATDLCDSITLKTDEIYRVYDVDGNVVYSGKLPEHVPEIEVVPQPDPGVIPEPEVEVVPPVVEPEPEVEEYPEPEVEIPPVEDESKEEIIEELEDGNSVVELEEPKKGFADFIIQLVNSIIKIVKLIFKF